MALSSYTDLKASVIDWLDRDDLNSRVDDFIDIAEARHAREVRIREMREAATLSLTQGARTVALPEDFLDFDFLRIRVPSSSVTGRRFLPDLNEVTTHELTRRSINDARRPMNFAVHEDIEFDAEADQNYTVELFYYVQLPALSDSQATNALLTKAADVYLYATLSASAPFLLNDERVPLWESLYMDAKDGLNMASRKSRRGGPLISRVSGATP